MEIFFVALLAVFALTVGYFLLERVFPPPVFSTWENKNFELIKKAKEFGQTLGLEKTNDFEHFIEEDPSLTILAGCSEFKLPFSFIDPALERCGPCGPDEQERFVRNRLGYLFHTLVFNARAGGSVATRDFLSKPDSFIMNRVLHEDSHGSWDLPHHMNEAAANLVGLVGEDLFYGDEEKKIKRDLANFLKWKVVPCLKCMKELARLYSEKGNLSASEFKQGRANILRKYGHRNVIELATENTYHHYFPLMLEVLRHLDFDLSKFIEFFKNFPYKSARATKGSVRFQETLEIEREAEKYIKRVIGR